MTHKESLMKIGELMVDLVIQGLEVTTITSIMYEEFVRKLENEDDECYTEKQLEGFIDCISAFQKKNELW